MEVASMHTFRKYSRQIFPLFKKANNFHHHSHNLINQQCAKQQEQQFFFLVWRVLSPSQLPGHRMLALFILLCVSMDPRMRIPHFPVHVQIYVRWRQCRQLWCIPGPTIIQQVWVGTSLPHHHFLFPFSYFPRLIDSNLVSKVDVLVFCTSPHICGLLYLVLYAFYPFSVWSTSVSGSGSLDKQSAKSFSETGLYLMP